MIVSLSEMVWKSQSRFFFVGPLGKESDRQDERGEDLPQTPSDSPSPHCQTQSVNQFDLGRESLI